MTKFNEEYLHTEWSDELEGKTGFFANDLTQLIIDINGNPLSCHGKCFKTKEEKLKSPCLSYYFPFSWDGKYPFRYFYCDKRERVKVKKFLAEVKELARKYKVNFFIVTDGASMIDNHGNEAVENCRQAHVKWELEHGLNPWEDSDG